MQIHIEDIRKVNAWISYALKHNVEVLDLSIYTDSNDIKFIPSIFACKSLRELTLHFCELNLPARICLPALRFLKLNGVTIQNGKLFSVLHSLETLILGHACFIDCSTLKISATRLKSLKMDVQLTSSLVISSPNLVSLELYISQELPGAIVFHGGMEYLDDAVINIEGLYLEAAVQLLGSVKNARSLLLTVAADFDCAIIKELQKDLATLKRIQFQFFNLKLLRIEIRFSHIDFVFINNLLKHSPQLESLFLRNTGGDTETTDVRHCQDIWSKHELPHLKLVEVHGFDGTKGEVEMVEFFLKNAIVLERLIILTSKAGQEGVLPERELMKIGRKILTYPRASSSVGILFTPIDEETLQESSRRVVF
ncbi:hypothetical protein ACHQM5_002923 [Ranunculus cassubicifolius]